MENRLTPSAIADAILAREGGYVNDKDDPGGATNHGVTIHTMRRLGLDLDNDGDVDTKDVKLLTAAQAKQIFIVHYFNKPRIAELPESLHGTVFDMYVNAGGNAIKILQRLLNRFDKNANLSVDGVLGKQSIGAANRAASVLPPQLYRDAYSTARRNYYFALADRRAASRKYARTRRGGKGGWIRRAEEFMSAHYHMTPAEFRSRTSKWG